MKAIVTKIVMHGRHGPYAVAKSNEYDGSITFSLNREVWQEKDLPELGSIVKLDDLRQKVSGWRATKSRYFRPGDEDRGFYYNGQELPDKPNFTRKGGKKL